MEETFPLASCVTRARSSTNLLRVGRSGTTSLAGSGRRNNAILQPPTSVRLEYSIRDYLAGGPDAEDVKTAKDG